MGGSRRAWSSLPDGLTCHTSMVQLWLVLAMGCGRQGLAAHGSAAAASPPPRGGGGVRCQWHAQCCIVTLSSQTGPRCHLVSGHVSCQATGVLQALTTRPRGVLLQRCCSCAAPAAARQQHWLAPYPRQHWRTHASRTSQRQPTLRCCRAVRAVQWNWQHVGSSTGRISSRNATSMNHRS